MEHPKQDPFLTDIHLLIESGLVKFMFPDDDSDINSRPERLRQAYSHSWQKVHDYLLDPSADWRTLPNAIEKLNGLYLRICDIEEKKELSPYVHLAYLGLWSETEDSMSNAILYDNVPRGTYAVDVIRDEIEYMAFDADFSKPPEYVARYIMSFAMSVHLARLVMGEGSVPSRDELRMGFKEHILTKFQ